MARYVSGKIIDEGIDGEKFIPDYLWVCQTAEIASACRDKISSKIYRLVEVKEKQSNVKK